VSRNPATYRFRDINWRLLVKWQKSVSEKPKWSTRASFDPAFRDS